MSNVLENNQLEGRSRDEWIDLNEVGKIIKSSRSTVYNLIEMGAFKTVSLRRPGTVRGRRLVARDSVYSYLESMVDQAAA